MEEGSAWGILQMMIGTNWLYSTGTDMGSTQGYSRGEESVGIEAGVEEIGCHGLRRSLFCGMRLVSNRARRKRKAL